MEKGEENCKLRDSLRIGLKNICIMINEIQLCFPSQQGIEVVMEKIQASTWIHQPVERVYAYVCDPQTRRQWQPEAVESIPLASDSGEMGARSHNKVRGWAGLTLEVIQETQEFVPNRRFAHKLSEVHGLIDSCSEWDFEVVNDGTRVTIQHAVDLHGWLRLAAPVFVPAARRKVEADLVRLKKRLEAGEANQADHRG